METTLEKKKTTSFITSLVVLLALVAMIQGYFLYHLHQKNQTIEAKMMESQNARQRISNASRSPLILRTDMAHPAAGILSQRQDEWDPFRDMMLMQRHMDRMVNHFLDDAWIGSLNPFRPSGLSTMSPNADFEDVGDAWIIRFDMPGLEKNKIELEVKNGFLSVRAEREAQKTSEDESEGFYAREIQYGSFARMIPLPSDADESKVEANYDKGVLTVRIGKKASETPSTSKIAVQ